MIYSKVSDTTNEIYEYLKQNEFMLNNINFNEKSFIEKLIKLINSKYLIYKDISFNHDKSLQKNHYINLTKNIYKSNNKSNLEEQPQKIIIILKFLKENHKRYYEYLLQSLETNNDKIKLDSFLSENLSNMEEFHDWMNQNGIDLVKNLNVIIQRDQFDFKFDTLIPKDIFNQFTSFDILNDIEINFNHGSEYTLIYDSYKIKGIFLIDNISINPKFIKSIMLRCLIWLAINNYNNNINEITFKIWLSKINKKLPESNSVEILSLGPKEVNTGCTYRGDCNSILLWRCEEIKKVLIHEMGHCLELEFGEIYHDNIILEQFNSMNKTINNMFKTRHEVSIRLYEAYNEVWALIINIIFCMIESKIDESENYFKIFCEWLCLEVSFSLYQCAKILYYFKINTFRSFCNNESWNLDILTDFNQNSSIISYYIIKASLLFNFGKFIEFCQKNNSETYHYIKFNTEKFKNYEDLIIGCLTDRSFNNIIDNYIEEISLLEPNKIYKSMRMTAIEN